ncbi:hypothetical protein GBAR_LOCUS7802 [Geodia barretti]|uniref:Uncharacterized protein n=1 Tax=Geodia barretti TaxID=519541 RepID=A0AA35WF16_GEOBA|nr:hypothetical protein GBAR_LOCUS7802 [Geodia barretti]
MCSLLPERSRRDAAAAWETRCPSSRAVVSGGRKPTTQATSRPFGSLPMRAQSPAKMSGGRSPIGHDRVARRQRVDCARLAQSRTPRRGPLMVRGEPRHRVGDMSGH